MRVILGLDAADEGTALIGGRPYAQPAPPAAATSGRCWTPPRCSRAGRARNHLLWLAHSQGLAARRVDEVIEQAGLQAAARRKAGGYSLGMRQRLGHRRRAARRPAGADARRAVQRHGPRGHRLDARLPAVAGRPGPRRAGVQPPDERAAGHRRPPGRGRPRPGHRRHQRGRPDRRRVRRPGHACAPPRGRRR